MSRYDEYPSEGGFTVHRTRTALPVTGALDEVIDALDERLGMVLTCDSEYPGRYSRREIGFLDPPVRLACQGRSVTLTALNERGRVLLAGFEPALRNCADAVDPRHGDGSELVVTIREPAGRFAEEQRSHQPSVFSVVRAIIGVLRSSADEFLGLYGAFGYDLAFQFEPAASRLPRPPWQRDLVLYLPDELIIVDHRRGVAEHRRYEFTTATGSTRGLSGGGTAVPFVPGEPVADRSMPPGAYADLVREARKVFATGDLFEVVLSQSFFRAATSPAGLFRRLRAENPSPYGFLINLGQHEHLVGSSPEMYVRVSSGRVETCPVSGTVPRGGDALADADRILTLLNSAKDASELTMCTDVDRNDKARICEPDSVRVIGRRQVEMYSRLIHTVDHVEGVLRTGYDGLDALLAHAWAVTVTGAPKIWAMRFIEDHEPSSRGWYGGAVGMLGCNGDVDTGLTIRTIRIRAGVAEVRAGATLLFDSVPEREERETELKAEALLAALRPGATAPARAPVREVRGESRPRLLILDHQDSFVHMLAGYFRSAGADVHTLRAPPGEAALAGYRPELVVLSPGPGRPADFAMSETLAATLALGVPVFGVCLGLQGIVEFFGGTLATLPEPVHGKASEVTVTGGRLLARLPKRFPAGRYHSLFAADVPSCLEVTARTDDGVVMAVEHRDLPVAAVGFHPESILTRQDAVGAVVIDSVLRELVKP